MTAFITIFINFHKPCELRTPIICNLTVSKLLNVMHFEMSFFCKHLIAHLEIANFQFSSPIFIKVSSTAKN